MAIPRDPGQSNQLRDALLPASDPQPEPQLHVHAARPVADSGVPASADDRDRQFLVDSCSLRWEGGSSTRSAAMPLRLDDPGSEPEDQRAWKRTGFRRGVNRGWSSKG